MPLAVLRDLSAPMGSDVFVETLECNFRPTLGLDGLIAETSEIDRRFP